MAEQGNRTSSALLVQAPPGRVFDVIADLEAYPQWAGDVREVVVLDRGEDGLPQQVRFDLQTPALRDVYVLAYTWDIHEDGSGEVSWTLVDSGVLRAMDGTYTLQAAEGDATLVTYTLAVDLKVPMLGLLRRKAERVIVETALKGLQRRAQA